MERPPTQPGSNKILVLIASIRRQFSSHVFTAFFLGLFLFVPSLLLSTSVLSPSLNRRGTAQLFAMIRRARLVQSFQADPAASVPQIWEKRLSASTARERWRRQGRVLWWLIWLDDGEPLLVLPKPADPASLDVFFADELHRTSFDQRPPLEPRRPSVLEQNCLRRLSRGTAVQWKPSGLASISGPLFSALASVSHGCLSVSLEGDLLMAEGPVASSPFVSLNDGEGPGRSSPVRGDEPSAFLELNSDALKPLLGSFLNNPLIAEQLTSRYELPQELRDGLLAAPVALRVEPLDAGRFRASVQARLMLPAEQIAQLKPSLVAVSKALLQRGFQREQRPLQSSDTPSPKASAEVWLDPQGDPSGGWWLGPERKGRVEVLFALGDAPSLGQDPMRRHGHQRLRLRARPDALAELGWLGPGWPSVIGKATHLDLEMTALPKEQQPGWLRLQLELR